VRSAEVRANRRPQGHTGGQLGAAVARQGRRSVAAGAKLRNLPFETAIIERYRRRETSVEEALIEMYLAGVSVRRVEDITQALWGTRVSASTVSDRNQKIYKQIEECKRHGSIVCTASFR
jgi:putative transposase